MADNPQSQQSANPGDVTWVRLDRRSRLWWPAQVVDEDIFNAKWRRKKKAAGDVMVRLYGTYCYLYTNPSAEGPEFEKDLKRFGISAREAFQRALEKDMAQTLKDQHEEAETKNMTANANKYSQERNCLIPDVATYKSADTPKSKKRKATKNANLSPEAATTNIEANEFEGSSTACKHLGINDSGSVKTPPSSVRRTRIMQNLGLIAPSGSPFKIRA